MRCIIRIFVFFLATFTYNTFQNTYVIITHEPYKINYSKHFEVILCHVSTDGYSLKSKRC